MGMGITWFPRVSKVPPRKSLVPRILLVPRRASSCNKSPGRYRHRIISLNMELGKSYCERPFHYTNEPQTNRHKVIKTNHQRILILVVLLKAENLKSPQDNTQSPDCAKSPHTLKTFSFSPHKNQPKNCQVPPIRWGGRKPCRTLVTFEPLSMSNIM